MYNHFFLEEEEEEEGMEVQWI